MWISFIFSWNSWCFNTKSLNCFCIDISTQLAILTDLSSPLMILKLRCAYYSQQILYLFLSISNFVLACSYFVSPSDTRRECSNLAVTAISEPSIFWSIEVCIVYKNGWWCWSLPLTKRYSYKQNNVSAIDEYSAAADLFIYFWEHYEPCSALLAIVWLCMCNSSSGPHTRELSYHWASYNILPHYRLHHPPQPPTRASPLASPYT